MAFKYVKEEFVKIIEGTDWMGEATKRMAMKKVQSMGAYIAYPEEMLNHSKVNKFYEEVNWADECDELLIMLEISSNWTARISQAI